MTARRILKRDHFSRHYKSTLLCEWRAEEVLYIVVCTVACTASTVSAGVHGGLPTPLARECAKTRESTTMPIFLPNSCSVQQQSCNGPESAPLGRRPTLSLCIYIYAVV